MRNADSRDEEWRELIFRAFKDCFKQGYSYADITIKKVCEEAHISKPTFYRYFDNKETMSSWAGKKCVDVGFREIGRTCTWFVGFYRTCKKQMEFADFFARSAIDPTLEQAGHTIVDYERSILVETITRYHHKEIDTVLAFQIESLLASSRAMERYWGRSGMETPVEEIAAYLTSSVPFGLYCTLREPVNGQSDFNNGIDRAAIDTFKGRPMDIEQYQSSIEDSEAFVRQIFAQYFNTPNTPAK